jgi:hypothetical protein
VELAGVISVPFYGGMKFLDGRCRVQRLVGWYLCFVETAFCVMLSVSSTGEIVR